MYTYNLVQWFLFFYIYCFLGWVWESCYVSAKEKRWVNRGFMHGPFLPIYGSGAIMVLLTTLPVKDSIPLVFIFGMIGATVLEYFTGVAMEKMFHVRYWDYSSKPFNLNGHICLLSSIAWGAFSILMENVLHQPIEHVVMAVPYQYVEMITMVLTIGIAIDMTQSFNEAMDLKEMLMNMTENNEEIRRMKKRLEAIVAVIDDEAKGIREKAEESKQQLAMRLYDEKRKYGDKVKEQIARTAKVKLSAQRTLENNLAKSREVQSQLLHSLSEKINTYSEIAGTYFKGSEGKISEEIDKLLEELKGIKSAITEQQKKVSNIGNTRIKNAMKMLSRNPSATSKDYEEALKHMQLFESEKEE